MDPAGIVAGAIVDDNAQDRLWRALQLREHEASTLLAGSACHFRDLNSTCGVKQ